MMHTKRWIIFVIAAFLVSCQAAGFSNTSIPSAATFETAAAPASALNLPTATGAGSASPLPAFTINWDTPFAPALEDGSPITLTAWQPAPFAGKEVDLPANLAGVANPRVLDGLTSAEKAFLSMNGFVIIHSQEAQFGDIRVATAHVNGQPYYLTTDAAFHSLHLQFDDLLKAMEREKFRPQIIAITQATIAPVREYAVESQTTSLEDAPFQALAYLSVGLKLLEPEATIDPSVADVVSAQIDQIMAGGGSEYSVLFPDFKDDYGSYKPVGHYAGDPDLEAYFRGMTWFGRVHFRLADPENPAFVPSRVPLIVTLALRRAKLEGGSASDSWADLHRILTFVVGPSDDPGPPEYASLMDTIYGDNPSLSDLSNDSLWQDFLARAGELPAPRINSLFITSTKDLAPTTGWRFLGQRFTMDGMIFQNLIFDIVKPKPDNTRRDIPSGLDVMAAFGSSPALTELTRMGATAFPNYSSQMQKMQELVTAQPESQWLERFYDSWLYAFFPVLAPKAAAYPAYMRTAAWSYKDLNAGLGSWAELKHDTILYTKMPEGAGGGGPPTSGPAPSVVEPNPNAFYRMAYMARELSCGLQDLVLHQPCSPDEYGMRDESAEGLIGGMFGLGNTLQNLGDIAARELAGESTADDYSYIVGCLGMIECMNEPTPYNFPQSEMPKVPVVAAVSGSGESVLEAAVGNVDRIYVLAALEGKIEVAQGGVFSYYEFTQPRDARLTDDEWRAKLAAGGAALPEWASQFVLLGGKITSSLFFRVGDVYFITQAGGQLNVREKPSLSGKVLQQLPEGEYVSISGGPVQADGYTWWQLSGAFFGESDQPLGWAVENQDWYARSD